MKMHKSIIKWIETDFFSVQSLLLNFIIAKTIQIFTVMKMEMAHSQQHKKADARTPFR